MDLAEGEKLGRGERIEQGPLHNRAIRRHNGKRILDAVRRFGPISRADSFTMPLRADACAVPVFGTPYAALQLADVRLMECL